MAKVKQFTNETTFTTNKPQSISTGQLEYTFNALLTYGGLVSILATLAATYVYLLVQKIKN